MSKRKYRPGLPFEDIRELVHWLVDLWQPVYLRRGLDQKWKKRADVKFLHAGFAGSMHLLDLKAKVDRRLLLRAYPPDHHDPSILDVDMPPDPPTATSTRILMDICPSCHLKMDKSFDVPSGSIRYICRNQNCKGAWKKA